MDLNYFEREFNVLFSEVRVQAIIHVLFQCKIDGVQAQDGSPIYVADIKGRSGKSG